MSELCKTTCVFYDRCDKVASENPDANERAFRRMMDTSELHSRGQILAAQDLVALGDRCQSEAPEASRDCLIVAGAAVKQVIG